MDKTKRFRDDKRPVDFRSLILTLTEQCVLGSLLIWQVFEQWPRTSEKWRGPILLFSQVYERERGRKTSLSETGKDGTAWTTIKFGRARRQEVQKICVTYFHLWIAGLVQMQPALLCVHYNTLHWKSPWWHKWVRNTWNIKHHSDVNITHLHRSFFLYSEQARLSGQTVVFLGRGNTKSLLITFWSWVRDSEPSSWWPECSDKLIPKSISCILHTWEQEH